MDSVVRVHKTVHEDEKRQLRQELGTWTDLSNRMWDRYYDTVTDCIVNMLNRTTTNVDFHQVTKHTRRLLEFASEVAFSSGDIPAHSIQVIIASTNTVYALANLDTPDEPQGTPAVRGLHWLTSRTGTRSYQRKSRRQIRLPH
jgi:hypothetical protein